MEQLFEKILTGSIRLPFFDSELLTLERELPRSDWLALLMLQRRGEATMSELAADLGAPLSTATGIGARLERRRLIRRERLATDRRVIVMRLTAEGQELAARARSHIDSLLRRIQGALTPEELQQLMGLAQKILTTLQAPEQTRHDAPDTGMRRITIED